MFLFLHEEKKINKELSPIAWNHIYMFKNQYILKIKTRYLETIHLKKNI